MRWMRSAGRSDRWVGRAVSSPLSSTDETFLLAEGPGWASAGVRGSPGGLVVDGEDHLGVAVQGECEIRRFRGRIPRRPD